jgi:hypothetical protein
MILITTFYIPNNVLRENEINKCLKKNSENPFIEKIYLLNDKIYNLPFHSKKIEQIIINNSNNYKLRFDDSINFINNNEYCKGKFCILSNSDIYFDKTLEYVNNSTISNNVFGLLRYDENSENSELCELYSKDGKHRDNSQDCWIFKSPLKVDVSLFNFEFGTLGCDNVFANIIYNSGIYISNPCYSIKSIHVHSSNFRTYDESTRLSRRYCNLPPCKLREMPDVYFTDHWANRIELIELVDKFNKDYI